MKMKRRRHTRENEDTKRGRHQHNEHENEDSKDRLSDSPDCILLHILSFLNAKYAVRTCLLSTRWKHLWKRLPSLTLHDNPFSTSKGFNEFVNRILSLRDASMAVNALNFETGFGVKPDLLERIVRYAVSHNIKSLRLCHSGLFEHILPSLFSCPSLTSLDINPHHALLKLPNLLNLPALTCLKLHHFSFCNGNDNHFEPFSALKSLNTLILDRCIVLDVQTLYISSTTLLNLSIYPRYGDYLDIELCAPNLRTFAFRGGPSMNISGSDFFSIEQVAIHLDMPDRKYSINRLILFIWLIELVNIKSLTLSECALQALFIILLKLKSPSWYNLKSLKLEIPKSYGLYITNQRDVNLELAGKSMKEKAKLRKASKAIDFLLQNSPSAKVGTIW